MKNKHNICTETSEKTKKWRRGEKHAAAQRFFFFPHPSALMSRSVFPAAAQFVRADSSWSCVWVVQDLFPRSLVAPLSSWLPSSSVTRSPVSESPALALFRRIGDVGDGRRRADDERALRRTREDPCPPNSTKSSVSFSLCFWAFELISLPASAALCIFPHFSQNGLSATSRLFRHLHVSCRRKLQNAMRCLGVIQKRLSVFGA